MRNNVSSEEDALFIEFLKKNYAKILCVIGLSVVFAGYSSYQDSKYLNGRLKPDPIAPFVREEGTLDYTLIDWIFKDKEYFEHWVLRFPEDANVTRPEDSKLKGPIIINGLKFGNGGHNRRLAFHLKMPEMNFLPKGEKKFDKTVARISVNARHQIYKEKTNNYKGQIETGFSGRQNQLNCVRQKQIAKGFFQIRDATAAEKEAHGPSYKRYLKDKCGHSNDYINFAHYDEAGDLLAKGRCRISDLFKSEKASCDFRIWLPQGRDANVRLAPKYLEDFPLIYLHAYFV